MAIDVVTKFDVTCDTCGQYSQSGGTFDTFKEAMEFIKRNRWTSSGDGKGEHYCWTCSLIREADKLPSGKWTVIEGTTPYHGKNVQELATVRTSQLRAELMWVLGGNFESWKAEQVIRLRDAHRDPNLASITDVIVRRSDIHPYDVEDENE